MSTVNGLKNRSQLYMLGVIDYNEHRSSSPRPYLKWKIKNIKKIHKKRHGQRGLDKLPEPWQERRKQGGVDLITTKIVALSSYDHIDGDEQTKCCWLFQTLINR